MDVLIAGAGPAALALAAACARLGLSTALADPAPEAAWPATYALWADEPPGLPAGAIGAAPAKTLAMGTTEHSLCRRYVIADNGGLRDWPTDATVRLLTGQLFFALPEEPQRASTSGREELSGTASTMTEIFGTPWNLRGYV